MEVGGCTGGVYIFIVLCGDELVLPVGLSSV